MQRSVSYKRNNCNISVEYKDYFHTENCLRVINFDECYTSVVGTRPEEIKATSICGQFLLALEKEGDKEFNIDKLIQKYSLKPERGQSKYQSKNRYKPGTIIPYKENLLLAFARLDENGKAKFFSRDEYIECLFNMWKEINKYDVQEDVCIPILGDGVTRFVGCNGSIIPKQELLDIVIGTYKLSPYKIKAPNKLRIICRRSEDFSLNKIEW